MGVVLFGDQILSDRERKNLIILETIRRNEWLKNGCKYINRSNRSY